MTMKHSIFAMELCFPFDTGLHATLRAHVKAQPSGLGYQDKWALYRAAREDLVANLPRCERGCWDYFDDDERAQSDYRMWVNGMLTDETARTSPSGTPDPYRGGDPRYMTFTMAFLIEQDTPTDQAMANLCNIPEQRLWERQSFARILGGLGVLNFASVQSDVLYLIPRDDDWALTAEDMSHPKFTYLRPLY